MQTQCFGCMHLNLRPLVPKTAAIQACNMPMHALMLCPSNPQLRQRTTSRGCRVWHKTGGANKAR